MRYRLRTLLIVLVLGPPVLAAAIWTAAAAWYWAHYRSDENEIVVSPDSPRIMRMRSDDNSAEISK